MPVYVDNLVQAPWPHRFACHMMADTDAELEFMARRLSLNPGWRDNDLYDLTPGKRRYAIATGAVKVTAKELVELRRAKRKRIEQLTRDLQSPDETKRIKALGRACKSGLISLAEARDIMDQEENQS